MTHRWSDALQQLGLETAVDDRQLSAVPPDEGICHLDPLTLLSIAGEDAETFLQGQLTGDVKELADGPAQPVAHCTPKGRALASCLAWRDRSGPFRLLLPSEVADSLTRRLQMFLMRSKATVTRDDDALLLGIWGPGATATVAAIIGDAPTEPFGHSDRQGAASVHLPGSVNRFVLVLSDPAGTAVETLAASPAQPTGYAAWRLQDIRAGLPWVEAATREAFIPQMINLDRLGGISFTKGCYVGQEVVARLHYLGQVKRRCLVGSVTTDTAPLPGTVLHSAASKSRQGAGTVTDAVRLPDGRCELLAVVETALADGDDLHLDSVDGPTVTLRAPPYPLADPDATSSRD